MTGRKYGDGPHDRKDQDVADGKAEKAESDKELRADAERAGATGRGYHGGIAGVSPVSALNPEIEREEEAAGKSRAFEARRFAEARDKNFPPVMGEIPPEHKPGGLQGWQEERDSQDS